MIGQIATFMENLHLSYTDVLTIPYRILVLMTIDKLSIDTRDEKTETLSGREMMKRKTQ